VFDVKYWNLEWYFQDNWRVNRKLTLDYGVRFYHQTPQVDKNLTFAVFDPTKYDKAKAPRIYVPGFDANRRRVAVDPLTKAIAPVAAIGLFVPNTGDPANGMRTPGQNGDPLEAASAVGCNSVSPIPGRRVWERRLSIHSWLIMSGGITGRRPLTGGATCRSTMFTICRNSARG